MKQILLFISLFLLCNSCKKEPFVYMSLVFENRCDSITTVALFPNHTISVGDSKYLAADFSSGVYNDSVFLYPGGGSYLAFSGNNISSLYATKNIQQTPFDLITAVFDSVHVITKDSVYVFLPDSAFRPHTIAYSNISWEYVFWEYDETGHNPTEEHRYTLFIPFQ